MNAHFQMIYSATFAPSPEDEDALRRALLGDDGDYWRRFDERMYANPQYQEWLRAQEVVSAIAEETK